MFYHENDYLVPVLLGSEKKIKPFAAAILQHKRARPHLFGNGFSFLTRLRYNCHKIGPSKDIWKLAALCDFADMLDSYYTPALILCCDDDKAFYRDFCDKIERRFVVIEFEKYMQKEETDL